MFRGKKYQESAKQIDKATLYDPKEGLELICKTASAKFDETVELHVKLGVDSRHADQQVRGAIVLPNGTGKTVRVLVFAKGDKAEAAKAAGADYVGEMDLVEKIQKENWFDFDVVVATPDMMGVVGRLGKVLGPKGLMPSPKAGTVTPDVAKAVQEAKAGKVEYRLDKTNIIHCPIGKVSFGAEKLFENYQRPHRRYHQGQARRCQGPVYQVLRGRFHHGPRREDERQQAAVICEGTAIRSPHSSADFRACVEALEIHKVFLRGFACQRKLRGDERRLVSWYRALSGSVLKCRKIVIFGLTSCEALDIILVAFQRQQVAKAVSPAEDGKSF